MALTWIICAIRRAAALAVILAPVIIAATHGPGLPVDAALSAEHLLHGDSHDKPEPGQSGTAHDAMDHEHQTQVILPQSGHSPFQFIALRFATAKVMAGSLSASGLRRPPRSLSV